MTEPKPDSDQISQPMPLSYALLLTAKPEHRDPLHARLDDAIQDPVPILSFTAFDTLSVLKHRFELESSPQCQVLQCHH